MSVNVKSLSRKQRISLKRSNSRINLWHGSVRSGKTFASVLRWLAFCATAPEGPLIMVGKTTRTLKQNILDPMKEMLGPSCFSVNYGRGEARIGRRSVYLASAHDEKSQDKIRGGTFAGAYGDELTLWPRSFYTMLLSRLSIPGAKGFFTTNPDNPFHFVKTDILDRLDELDVADFHFVLDDNESLDPVFVSELKKEYTGLFYKRFILGLWVLAEGSIYDMFDDAVHVVQPDRMPEIHSMDNLYFGIDYGTSNPCVFLLAGFRGRDLYIYDEYYYDSRAKGKQKTDDEYVADFRDTFGNFATFHDKKTPVIIDPSASSFITAMKGKGFKVVPGDNSVLDGIRNVSSMLSQNRIHISAKCENLIKEFQSYIWDAKAQSRGEDKPVKENDHGPDALRYLVKTMLFNKKHVITSRSI